MLELLLFGPMEVRVSGVPLPRLSSRKARWALALLALRGGREVEREWLAGILWPESATPQALYNLREQLTELRRALGEEAPRLEAPTRRTLRLDLAGAAVDALAFDAAVRRGDEASLAEAVSLYRGPLLEDCGEEWCLEERRPREQSYLSALATLAAAATVRGDHAAAAEHLRRAIGVDPYREDLQRALMEALAAGGSAAEAMLVYRQFHTRLSREMAATPTEETTALFRQLRDESRARVRAHLPQPSGVLPSPVAPAPDSAGNLPQPFSAFVGREKELVEVRACLTSARLVTLTGTGGIGKTRLALRVAEECSGEYSDGAWFVDLAALTDPALVPQAVARALRVREDRACPPTDTLQDALGDRQLLLVLDNCEHLIDACARLADALLSSCPHLQILATSRQSLGLPGEISWAVPPLSLPAPAAPETPGPTPQVLMEFEAIHLLVARAATAPAAFALSENNAAATVQVCRRLDGIPLAIELAAARLKVLSIEQMAARLDDRFRLLTGGSRAALPRQQTLRATLDWSYDLLSPPERLLLQRLAVFAGGFTLEAAEAVCVDCGLRIADCGLGEPPVRPNPQSAIRDPQSAAIRNPQSAIRNDEVLDLLASLVDQSLVRAERRDGAARYVLLETTREYARERLGEAGGADEWRERHAGYFLSLAERAAPELRGGAQAEWLQRLEEEHDNLRAAIDCFLDRGAIEAGLRLGGALGWFWWMRGYLSEGRQRLQALLAKSGYDCGLRIADCGLGEGRSLIRNPQSAIRNRANPPLELAQARALNAAGMLADDQSDYEAARALFLDSLALSRHLGDRLAAAMALNNLGGLAVQARDYPAARSLYAECLALSREVEDRWWTAAALTNLGRVTLLEGEYTTARAQIESALEIQRQLKDKRAIARSLNTLGNMAARLAEDGAARALFEESLALARELGAKGVIEETLSMLGSLAREGGDHDAALAFHEEHLTIAREVGSASGIAESLYDLGLVARDRGEGGRARTLWSESLAIYQELGNKQRIADCLEGFASLAAQPDPTEAGRRTCDSPGAYETDEGSHRALRAARLFGAAAVLREVANAPLAARHRAEYERHLANARALLDRASFAAAWAEGQSMAVDEAVADALGQRGEHGSS